MSSYEDWIAHWVPMVRVARSILKSRHAAEDCAAATLAEVVAQNPENIQNHEAFLVTVVKRRAIDHQRKEQRRRAREAKHSVGEERATSDPAEEVVRLAYARWVDTAAREVLAPRAYGMLRMQADGLSTRRIAEEHGVSLRAVENVILRARKTMQATLAKAAAVLAVIGLGAKRAGSATAPAAVATMGALVLVIHVQAVAPGGDFERALPIVRPPAAANHLAAFEGSAATAPRTSRIARPVDDIKSEGPVASAHPRETQPKQFARLEGPAGASATIEDRETGGGEETLAEQVVACLENLEANAQHIGC